MAVCVVGWWSGGCVRVERSGTEELLKLSGSGCDEVTERWKKRRGENEKKEPQVQGV